MNLPIPCVGVPRLRVLAALAALSALGACTTEDPNTFAPECVPVGILAPAADLTTYAGPSRDLATLVTQASVVAVGGTCSDADQGHALHTAANVTITVLRGPAAGTRDITIPYFIAVLHNNRIVDKHALRIEAHFPPNVDRLALKSDPLVLDLPISRRMNSADWRLEVGLQLTPDQLAYNREHMPH